MYLGPTSMALFDILEGVSNMFPHQISKARQVCLLQLLLCSALLSSLATTYEAMEAPHRCHSNEFECSNGLCIADLWRCDEEDDCRDNSDEINCPEVVIVCSEGQFKCATDTCIPTSWLCDHELDCNDGSDEQECTSYTEQPMFKCTDRQSNIPTAWRCDRQADCGDQSDEIDCATSETVIPSFRCADGTEIDIGHRCDAIPHCQRGEDEKECLDCPGFLCSNNKCIQTSQYCDGMNDCRNGDDEPASCNPRCMVDNGGCEEICLQRGDTVVCDCNDGYELFNNIKCRDVNECEGEVNVCPGYPMTCFNEPGTYSCICPPGFIYEEEERSCYANDSVSPPVIFSTRESVMYLSKVHYNSTMNLTPGKSFRGIRAIDFDPREGTIFFSETVQHKILKNNVKVSYSCMPNFKQTVQRHNLKVTSNKTPDQACNCTQKDDSPVNGDCMKKSVVYQADVTSKGNTITYIGMTGGAFKLRYFLTSGEEEVVADEGVEMVDGIAYDWIFENLYFTEAELKKVEVISLKTFFRKILFETELDEPRGIAVHPKEGYLYFTDWGENPKIEKAAMDGSSRQIIIDENLYWPNGLCIEYTLKRLFWVNAVPSGYQGSFIASSDLDGGRIQVLVEGPSRVQLPFAISVFQDNIYWTDWGMESLMTANSFTGAGWSVVLRNVDAPMDIRVFNRKAKYDSDEEILNLCPTNKNACSHMCLAAPNNNNYSCGCPNNAFLAEDMKTCLCNSTAKLNEDGVTCGGLNMDSATPANEVTGSIRTPLPVETPVKFNLTMKCRIIDWTFKCRVRNSQELLTIPDNVPEEISCKLSKNTGELICKY